MPHQPLAGRLAGTLGVIGNISLDHVTYPGGRSARLLGGAALHVAVAATRAGLPAAPAAVIGTDLAWLASDPRLAAVDMSCVKVTPGKTCAFALAYDAAGQVTSTSGAYGVSESLTSHALHVLGSCPAWHVCCRRPLAAPLILGRLAGSGTPFSADFHLASAAEIIPAVSAALPSAAAVFVNAAELAILARAADLTQLRLVVVSDGPRPAVTMRHGEVTASVMPPRIAVSEVTGAGDTLAGTFLAAMARGHTDDAALTSAVTAASEAVARPGLDVPVDGG